MAHITEVLNADVYLPLVHESHELADLLKRRKPQYHEWIDELQQIVTRTHERLEEIKEGEERAEVLDECEGRATTISPGLVGEWTALLTELRAANQALRDLKHSKKEE